MAFVALILWTIIVWFIGAVIGTNVVNKSYIKDSNTYGVTKINGKFYRIQEIPNAPTKGTNRNPH